MALRPTLSIKQAGATANLLRPPLSIKRAGEPVQRKICASSNEPELPMPRYGIELSPCSAAALRVHRGPSTPFWPYICVGLLGSTSVGWPPVRVRSDNAAAGVNSSISLLSMLPIAVRRRRLMVVEQLASP
ncbi:hypothetical protein THAOC_35432 [Thalassiosira oceanica]|uniref:Uncharacterized protein n=1 Tax=Thalassiosira oceanica TaxID=159749 RepID=K0R1S7_THAOC|nr:hypothetical protein THAOC_35432 [Thalassiosira oceanica]|eukprot:EJK45930.1 hypothetical protein THAOC_35432 [Thalassiosira oceanica]